MFIIENTNSLLNFENIESIDVIEFDNISKVIATGIKKDYVIYESESNDKAWEAYNYITRAICEGYTSILIQSSADDVEVYKDKECEIWDLPKI